MPQKQYGGQAVIEGVMMRGNDNIAVAVRQEDGEITTKELMFNPWTKKFKFLKAPFVRGVFSLFQSLILGMRALTFSANQFAEEEEELTWWELTTSIGTALVLAILLFVVIPASVIEVIKAYIDSNLVLNLIEGVMKVSVLILYILSISQLNDIKRVFQYHGAEHKVINNYESDLDLKVENAKKFSTYHPRCGTNFLLIVMIVSILLFSFFGRPALINRILIHIALLPIVAGVSYELIKKAGQKDANKLFKWAAVPGLYLQRLTTSEPDDSQLEVAIKSLESVMENEKSN
ncbi:DUF1385 domain-containing protein [Halanaerobacter jeridensis]|uniref:Uncharacterized protein YqhQ n=1 Tax=Halanaerobacter jeridensis TaxID=706427 RepID=A0A938XT46_9FIRM|nr:DUF1385 domain-containing protein [Halanaerobacter jeridensis]MBM7557035.1 uncharacterized protein YqhQ [Halanaerobacter jeridensis]